jgi:hypothetical protein
MGAKRWEGRRAHQLGLHRASPDARRAARDRGHPASDRAASRALAGRLLHRLARHRGSAPGGPSAPLHLASLRPCVDDEPARSSAAVRSAAATQISTTLGSPQQHTTPVPLSKTRSRRVEPHGQPASARPRVRVSLRGLSQCRDGSVAGIFCP